MVFQKIFGIQSKREAVDSMFFPILFILFTTSLPSQPLRKAFCYCSQPFPFYGGGGGSSEQVDFSLGMLQPEASLPAHPCSSHSWRPVQRDNFRGIWGWSTDNPQYFPHFSRFSLSGYSTLPASVSNSAQCLASQTRSEFPFQGQFPILN